MNTEPVGELRLIPDLDDELCHALAQVEELLLTVAVWEEDPDSAGGLSAPVTGRAALAALNRVQDAVGPTQTRTGRATPAGRLFGPDGRYEHRPLRLVRLDPHDLEVLTHAAAGLGLELATNSSSELADAMAAGAEAAADAFGPPPRPVELVEALARALGLFDLAVTEDSTRLAALVTDAGGADLVLDSAGEAAYQRTADRFTTMWARGNPALDRFLS